MVKDIDIHVFSWDICLLRFKMTSLSFACLLVVYMLVFDLIDINYFVIMLTCFFAGLCVQVRMKFVLSNTIIGMYSNGVFVRIKLSSTFY